MGRITLKRGWPALACVLVAVALGAIVGQAARDGRPAGVAYVQKSAAIDHRRAQRSTHQPPTRRLEGVARKATTSAAAAQSPSGRVPNDPLYANAWALQAIGAPLAWQSTVGDPSVIVAVLDTGVDPLQPDLQGALLPGTDIVNRDDSPADDFGHGTLVTGLIAARGDNRRGAVGVCWRCSVLPIKVIGADGRGSVANVADGIRFAADHGARIVNMSFILSADDPIIAEAVRYAVDRGVVIVAAAGNSGSADPVYPAAYPGVISVGATDQADAPYPWSGHGPWVIVTAPGCGETTDRGGTYALFCGTSAATAIASGLAGLVLAATPSATPAQVAQALTAGAHPVGAVAAAGRIDAASAVRALAAAPAQTLSTIRR